MSYQIPQNVSPILTGLAEAIFPIGAWIKQKPVPKLDQLIPSVGAVPWRSAGGAPTLSTSTFEIAKFLEFLIANDRENVLLAPRWNAIRTDPGRFFKNREGKSIAQWRAERQLPQAKFGVFEPDSDNFAFVTQAPDGSLNAVSRMDFYDTCWKPLAAAYQSAPPNDPASWVAFRDKLRTDQFVVWPTAPVRSSAFLRQFTLDVLTACLGQRNPALRHPEAICEVRLTADDLSMTDNRVSLDPNYVDEYGIPVARISRKKGPNEGTVDKIGIDKMTSIFAAAQKRGAVTAPLGPKPANVRLVGDHQMGTCRMGDDPHASVVNQFCRLHDADNVFVVDSSFMPSGLGLNPMVTVVANALRVGTHIIDALRKGQTPGQA